MTEWPGHLQLAWAILRDDLHVTDERAFQLILGSISAAQTCADAVNLWSRNNDEAKARAKMRAAFKRVARCCRRAPAALRRRLDEAILPLLRQDPIDSEVIEAIFDVTAAEFERFSEQGAAAAALRAMLVTVKSREPSHRIKNNYEGLRAESQRNCEAALSKLRKNRNPLKAHMVFDALASGLDNKLAGNHDPDPATLRSNYVSALAFLWEAAGLHPGRAYREGDRRYKSKFHRYSDLVLTAVGEPWALRHNSGDLDHVRRQTYETLALTSREDRTNIGLSPSRTEWLISEYILRKGLGRRVKKTAS